MVRSSAASAVVRRHATRLLALGAFALAACEQAQEPGVSDVQQSLSVRQLEDVKAVQERYTPGLLRREGLLGTGIGLGASEPEIVVYALTRGHADRANVPERLDGYRVRVEVTGLIVAGDLNNPRTKERPAPNGFSVGHPDITAGTIGAKVKKADGSTYILSNNHVLANVNQAQIGDPALQPGPYDGGTAADQIGTLADYQPINLSGAANTIDAAIAAVDGSLLSGATPASAYGAPGTSVYSGSLLNKGVQKFGRTTNHTRGVITETNVAVNVCYEPVGYFGCRAYGYFTGQYGIVAASGYSTFSSGGDSGSLIVTDDANKSLVGLLFAGSSARTLANPIGPVLQRFGISIDVSSGGGGTPTDQPPAASFSVSCSGFACSFTDQSSDDQGIASRAWTFGDGATSTATNPTHTYAGVGSYPVTLTVTDTNDQTASASRTVTCSTRGKKTTCR